MSIKRNITNNTHLSLIGSAFSTKEQEKYDNMPENMQDSERGEAFQETADNLQDAADELSSWCEDIRSNLEV